MAIIHACGFECASSAHVTFTGSAAFSTADKRTGNRSIRINPSLASAAATIISATASGSIGVSRIYVKFSSLPNSNFLIIGQDISGSYLGAVFQASDSKIYPGSLGGSSPGSSGISVTTGVWYLVDVKVNATNSAAITLDVKVDGVACTQGTTSAIGSSLLVPVIGRPSGSTTADVYFDDLLLANSAADYPLGAGHIDHFVPTADGAHNIAGANDYERTITGTDIINSTTDSYLLIDDVPIKSAISDFINMIAPTASSYTEHVFGPAPGVSTPTTAPRAVQVLVAYHQIATGTGTMQISLNDNGTTNAIVTRSVVAGSVTLLYTSKQYASGPAGVWVIGGGGNGDFTDLRIRFEATAVVDANPDQYFDGAFIEAEFADVVNNALIGSLTLSLASTSAMVGAGSLIGSLTTALTPTSNLKGTGALLASSALTLSISSSIQALLAAIGSTTLVFTNNGAIVGSGILQGNNTIAFTPTGGMVGAGALIASSGLTFSSVSQIIGFIESFGSGSFTFTPSGSMVGLLAGTGSSQLAFSSSSMLGATGALIASGGITFSSASEIIGYLESIGYGSFAFAAVGEIGGGLSGLGTSQLNLSANAVINGAGALLAASQISFVLDGLLVHLPASTMDGACSIAFTPVAIIQGAGTVNGSINVTFSTAASIIGSAELIGQLAMSLGLNATIEGVADLVGSLNLDFVGQSTISGLFDMVGQSDLVFVGNSILTGDGLIEGVTSLSLSGLAQMEAEGVLAGATVMTFNIYGQPFGVSSPRRVIIIT